MSLSLNFVKFHHMNIGIIKMISGAAGVLFTLMLTLGIHQQARAEWNDSIRYRGEVNATFAAGDMTPFWLVDNQYGLSSVKPNNGYVRLSAFHDLDKEKRFSWGAGVDLAGAWNFTSPFIIHQLYGEVRYRCLNALIGSKEIPGCFNNTRLSSGNLLFSNNSRPIPQVRLGIFDYADIWGTRGWLGIKGYLAYGAYTDGRWMSSWVQPGSKQSKGVLYHSKGLWLRNGNPSKFPLTLEVGIEMAAQFGGTHITDKGEHIKMPHDLLAWLKAFVPYKGGEGTPGGEQANVQGNMVGSWNFCLNYVPFDGKWSIKAYFEHYFEDHSMLYKDFRWRDGLWGVEAKLPKNRIVSNIVYEFLHMKDQSGPILWNETDKIPIQVSGLDNYLNHYIYPGWQHWGMGIGNPLCLSPIFNEDHLMFLRSTRVIGHHIGFEGQPCDEIGYRVLASYTRNWGTYHRPLPEMQTNFSALLEVTWRPKKLKGWEGSLSIAGDRGTLISNNFGVGIKISKSGWLNF